MTGENQPSSPSGRIGSIDALRGFDMLWIIGLASLFQALTKESDSPFAHWLYWQFEHTEWAGFNGWDLIMPLFLFVVGAAMPFSLGKRVARGDSKGSIYSKIIRRVIILWILGMMCQGHLLDFDLSTLHIYSNTLQAIAAGYLIAAIVMLNANILWQVLITVILCVVYWVILYWAPGSEIINAVPTADGNIAMKIDKLILGRFMPSDLDYTWVLSSMTFGATTLLGVMAGHIIRTKKFLGNQKVLYLLGLGVAGLIVGWLLHLTVDPIIKKIWSSSMVLYAGGWSFLLIGLFYWVIDVLGYKKWAFVCTVVGMNAITVYTFTHVFGSTINDFGESLAGGLARHMGYWGPGFVEFTELAAVWLLLYWLYRQKVFLRI